ncbi:ABC transporter substrate-binding protein [Chelatococcus sp. GCM10030263]|uniref:ABC transporter substrate-binding protein n=1 Tax=Chelatococcus sp. GCM10030263 TaxID=3273387 RepID=UPI003615DF84
MAITRRQLIGAFVGAGTAAVVPSTCSASAGRFHRIVALDWASAETMVAIGQVPIATSSPYRGGQERLFDTIPDRDIVELGSMFEPNLELIQRLKPDLIFYAPWQAHLLPSLRRIAPVRLTNPRAPTSNLLNNALILTSEIGRELGAPREATEYLRRCDQELDALENRCRTFLQRALLICVLLPDGRHLSIYTQGSLFHDVLDRLGLKNAYRGPLSASGSSTLGIEDLAEYPKAELLYLHTGPQSDAALRLLSNSSLWSSLRVVQQRAVKPLGYVWPFGALPSAVSLARSLTAALGRPE